jgi:integrase
MTRRPEALPALHRELEKAKEYAGQSRAENTKRAYSSDWRRFGEWCEAQGLEALPASPMTVIAYITSMAERYKVATLQRHLVSISQAHEMNGHPSPVKNKNVRTVMEGIRRAKGSAQDRKAPVLVEDLRRMVEALPATVQGKRDRAMLLIGFAGAFRRSELVALDVGDVEVTRDGLVVTVRRSKTDQEGQGRKVGIPYGSNPATCPVRALQDWLEASEITAGPLFRPVDKGGKVLDRRASHRAVARLVKRLARAAGLDPRRFSGHSLRAGFATQAAMNAASDRSIMKQTGHRSRAMVDRYVRDGSLFRDNAAARLGL